MCWKIRGFDPVRRVRTKTADGAAWPRIGEGMEDLEWRLRYSEPSTPDIMAAAAVVNAYGTMVRLTQGKRNKVCKLLQEDAES